MPQRTSRRSNGARRAAAVVAVLAVGVLGFGAGYLVFDEPEQEAPPAPAAAPAVIIEGGSPAAEPEREAADRIGFPAFATRNTTRVGGADPIADAAGVALASYPSLGGVEAPQAVIIAPADSWQAGLAATPLSADPVAAPVLLSDAEAVPSLTIDALQALAPAGLEAMDGAQVIAVGGAAAPDGLETLEIERSDPAEIAAVVDRRREKLTGQEDPDHLLVVSSRGEDAGLSMPAAAWAARSGDPVLFAAGDEVPEATLKIVARHPKTPIYVLGPDSAISAKALGKLDREGVKPTRISGEEPVSNAIEFARFVDGDFGWNINDPGHGFVIANEERPTDAVVAAPLAAGGKPGPLLITDDAEEIPPELRGFLLDTKPGFEDDPARAVYNHVWLLGDPTAISVPFQAQVDELTKLVPIEAGTSGPNFGPGPGPEAEAEPGGGSSRDDSGKGGGDPGGDR